jgi:LysR family hydrogen peroxide-inducible transcriptional activator
MRSAPYPFTLRQLQYAAAVAERRSFRAAAQACHVSQPSLSAQVAELERGLGVRLFDRDRRGVLVTAAGEALLARARALLVAADDLVDAARRRADPLAGTVRLGILPTIAPYLLPAVAPAIRRRLPRLTVLWTEERTDALVRAVAAGALDGAIVAREAELGDLEERPLLVDPFVLAVPASHPLAADDGPVRAEVLRGERVLLLEDGHCLRAQALEVCSRARAEELGFRATSLPTLVQMVGAGAGVTLLPAMAAEVERRRAELRVRPFAPPAPARHVVLASRRGSALAPALDAVADVACRAGGPEASRPAKARGARTPR